MNQDKTPDPMSEERLFPEGVQRDVSDTDILEKDSSVRDKSRRKKIPKKVAPVRHKTGGKGGQGLLLWGMVLLLTGFAFPLLLVFLFKWPHPGQHLLIFGISYYKLLFIYFLTSALLIHASFFLLRARPLLVTVFFIVSLFCCFPFILGLRSNLTLYQTITGIAFFYGWPFFLNPAYVMIEFLLPAGVLIYLFLQIRNLFSIGARSYAFLCVAVYLSIATLLGLFGLNEARQPNIATALTGIKDYFANQQQPPRFDGNILRKPVLPIEAAPKFPSQTKYELPPAPPLVEHGNDPRKDRGDTASVSIIIGQLAAKVDVLEAEIREMRALLSEKKEAPQEEKPQPEGGATGENEISREQSAILDLEGRIRLLSEEVRAISDRVKKMTPLLPAMAEKPEKETDPVVKTLVETTVKNMNSGEEQTYRENGLSDKE